MKYKLPLWLIHLAIDLILIGVFCYIGIFEPFSGAEFIGYPLTQILFVTLLIVIWAACHLKIKKTTKKKNEEEGAPSSTELEILHIQEELPLKLWQRNFPESKEKPIVIITGPLESGKTTFLMSLGLPVAQVNYQQAHWYLFHDLIAIEISAAENLVAWSNLLSTIKPWRKKIIALINCFSLKDAKNNLAKNFDFSGHQLTEFEYRLKRSVNTYFILNQLDCLEGFNYFSQHLSEAQKQQLFCFNSESKNIATWVDNICEQVKQQAMLFKEQRLVYMEFHRTLDERNSLYGFPERFFRLSRCIKQGLELLVQRWDGVFLIKGIFFSALDAKSQQSFFIASFWPYILAHANQHSVSSTSQLKNYTRKLKMIFYFCLMGAFLFALGLTTRHYIITLNLLNQIKTNITSHKMITTEKLSEWHYAVNHETSIIFKLSIDNQLKDKVNDLYKERLTIIVNAILEKWFQQSLSKSPSIDLYKNLQAYLMLGKLQDRNVTVLVNWLKNNPEVISKNLFYAYIDADLNLTLPLDVDLIQNARESLKSLPNNRILFLLFVDTINSNAASGELFTSEQLKKIFSIFQANNSTFNFPTIYTKTWFLQNYDVTFARYLKCSQQLNWVMDLPVNNQVANYSKERQVITQLYFDKYLAAWQSHFQNLKIRSLVNLQKTSQVVISLSNPDSMFDMLLNKLIYNTDFDSTSSKTPKSWAVVNNLQDAKIARSYLDPVFEDLQQFVQPGDKKLNLTYAEVKANLHALGQELAVLALAPDNNQTIALLVKTNRSGGTTNDPLQILEQQIPNTPQPLRSWLQQLSDQIWQVLKNKVEQQLQALWQQQVMSFYSTAIENRFPVNLTATQSIALSDFNRFYASNGLVSQFYQQYLRSYMNRSDFSDVLSDEEIKSFGLDTAILEQLKIVKLVQSAFFPDNTNTAKINFSLQPYNLSPNVAQVRLIIANQTLSYGHGPKTYTHFSWPSEKQTTAIIWTDLQGKEYRNTINDPWGIFRLLHQATIQPMNGNLLVTFNQNNFSASFILKTDSAFNAFSVFLMPLK